MERQPCTCHPGAYETPGPLRCEHLAMHLQSAEEGKEEKPGGPARLRTQLTPAAGSQIPQGTQDFRTVRQVTVVPSASRQLPPQPPASILSEPKLERADPLPGS